MSKYLCRSTESPLGVFPGVVQLDHEGNLFSLFGELPHKLHKFTHPPAVTECFPFPTGTAAFVALCIFVSSCSGWGKNLKIKILKKSWFVISWWIGVLHIKKNLYFIFWEPCVSVYAPVKYWVACFLDVFFLDSRFSLSVQCPNLIYDSKALLICLLSCCWPW